MKNNVQEFKAKHILYAFTSYAFLQFIGYLGTAYTIMLQPTLIVIMLISTVALSLGFLEWSNKQNRTNGKLSDAQILGFFIPSFIIIALLITITAIGAWIAL